MILPSASRLKKIRVMIQTIPTANGVASGPYFYRNPRPRKATRHLIDRLIGRAITRVDPANVSSRQTKLLARAKILTRAKTLTRAKILTRVRKSLTGRESVEILLPHASGLNLLRKVKLNPARSVARKKKSASKSGTKNANSAKSLDPSDR